MKRTLLFALALIASGPVDGVAQDVNAANRELTNRLYEGRSCRRGTAVGDSIADAMISRGDTVYDFVQERSGWLNCRYVLDPHLDFWIENVGPNATLSILKVSPPLPWEIAIEAGARRCLAIVHVPSFIYIRVSMDTGEIYPYNGEDFQNGGVCRG
jgi:hypothetical protein